MSSQSVGTLLHCHACYGWGKESRNGDQQRSAANAGGCAQEAYLAVVHEIEGAHFSVLRMRGCLLVQGFGQGMLLRQRQPFCVLHLDCAWMLRVASNKPATCIDTGRPVYGVVKAESTCLSLQMYVM